MVAAKLTSAALALLDKANTIAIISPDRPDYDSVASDLALAAVLETQGKRVYLLGADKLPDKYSWLGGADTFIFGAQISSITPKPELIVMMDMTGPEMAPKLFASHQWLLKEPKSLVLDHHATDTSHDVTLAVTDVEAASNTEMLHWLFKAWGWEVNKYTAELLLLGIIFDTDRFYNSNTDANVLLATHELLTTGADFYQLNQRFEQSRALPFEQYQRFLEIQASSKTVEGIAYGRVPYAQVKEFSKSNGFVGRFVDSLRGLKDIKVAFVTAEAPNNEVFVSMRSQPGINIGKLAEKYNGGGHPVAAVARFAGKSIAEAEQTILKEVRKLI